MPDNNKYNSWYLTLVGVTSGLDIIFFSYGLGIFNSVLDVLQKQVFPEVPNFWVTFIVSCPFITGVLGVIFAGSLADKYGRRKIIMIADVIGIIGALLTTTTSLAIIITGRLIVGVAVGIMSIIVPVYFTEISPTDYKGTISGGIMGFEPVGVLLSFLGGLGVSEKGQETTQLWRVLLGLSIIAPLLNFISLILFFREETPNYLVNQFRLKEAKQAIDRIYYFGAEERLQELIKERDYIGSQRESISFKDAFNQKFRMAVIITTILVIMQELAPSHIISVYIKRIFGEGLASSDNLLPKILSVALISIHVISAICFPLIGQALKQRTKLLIGTLFVGVFSLLYGLVGLKVGTESFASRIFLLLWPIPYALGMGALIYLIVSETLPAKLTSIPMLHKWIFAFLTIQFYPNIADAIGNQYIFIVSGAITLIGTVFLWKFVVESQGKNKEEIIRKYSGNAYISNTLDSNYLNLRT